MTSLFLAEGERTQHFSDADFPLALGLTGSGALAAGAAAEAAPALWLLVHGERLSIQPETVGGTVHLNGMSVDRPVWLHQGDEIGLGDIDIGVTASEGVWALTVARPAPATEAEAEIASVPEASEQAKRFGTRFGQTGTTQKAPLLAMPVRITLGISALLFLGAVYVVAASPLRLQFSLDPDSVSVWGFLPAIPVGDSYLALPGEYDVEASKAGYRPIRRKVSIGYGALPIAELVFEKLPGQLSVVTSPTADAKILVDGAERGTSPATIEIDAGEREIKVVSERYLPETRRIAIEGMGRTQSLEIALLPAWSTLSVSSVPDGAAVKLDGREIGETPVSVEAMQGAHELEFSKPGWKPATRRIETRASIATVVPPVALERIDGTLALTSEPAGAAVQVNGQFQGQTPLSLTLTGERDYRLSVSKAGYENDARSVRVEGGKTGRVAVQLQPEFGTVFVTTNPPGATLTVNGKPSGSATQRLTLQTLPQTIEIARPGYESHKEVLTPQKGVAKRIEVTLKTVGDALKERVSKGVVTPGGQKMALIFVATPVRFTVGSPRRDPARRSNESEYPVELTRSFLMSEKEVTNGEFRKFRPTHASGSHQATSLNDADQPAVNLSWEDAARYANWLSTQEGLVPAYRDQGGKVAPVAPLTNGYRLPTEAEWEFAARHEGGQRPAGQPLQFAWGDSMPPPANSGNFAHDGSGLPFAIPGYNDGFVASAPVGKFAPNKAMIYDLSGNVAEWCHDYYDVPMPGGAVRQDPAGPADGRFHVIKGASWRSGSASELRFTYRDYAEKPRDDLGFRIVKYADKAP